MRPPFSSSESVSGDSTRAEKGGSANTIKIDLGKSVSAIALCAALCGICAATSLFSVYIATRQQADVDAHVRVLQNHVDEATNKAVILEKLEESYHAKR
jgi:hypothetical protein